jgi:crotonobetainyl-CoA:carnitine CoA-transferase CaiB-like acyl-CoA transferase
LWDAGVPVARVTPPWDVHRNPQLAARQFFETLVHPLIGCHSRYPGWPFRPFVEGASWHRRAAPMFGEHNEEVLVGVLGLGDDELARLRLDGVVGERPVGV